MVQRYVVAVPHEPDTPETVHTGAVPLPVVCVRVSLSLVRADRGVLPASGAAARAVSRRVRVHDATRVSRNSSHTAASVMCWIIVVPFLLG